MTNLLLASLAFLFIHLAVSGTALRGALVRAIGERAYLGLFSLASLGIITWMVMSYNRAIDGPNWVYWVLPLGVSHAGSLIMLIATFLTVVGILTPGPTSVGMEAMAAQGPKGIHRITRHPFLWGVMIWAAWHMAANGDRVSLVFFTTFFLLTAFGTRSIDAKRAKSMGENWTAYAAQSSNIPFAAILAGKQKLAFGEIGIVRIIAAIAVFAALFYSHLWLFAVSPVPGWLPY